MIFYMENFSTFVVRDKETIKMEFISKKVLTLKDVCHVSVRKNLISSSLLNKFGFKLILQLDKFFMAKICNYMGKGHSSECMFKLDINN